MNLSKNTGIYYIPTMFINDGANVLKFLLLFIVDLFATSSEPDERTLMEKILYYRKLHFTTENFST